MHHERKSNTSIRAFHAVPLLAAMLMGSLATAGPATADPLATADPSRVTPKMLKKCAKCHGEGGISDDPEAAHLVGQPASYLFKQLQAFKTGAREGGRMNKTARKLSDQQHADLAVYFSSRELPAQNGVSMPPTPALVDSGDAARGIDACADCHGGDGRGKKDEYDAPALAGMTLDYFKLTMAAFRDGERNNDADGIMGKAAKPLADDEISALADYYLALGQRKPIPPL